MSGWARATRAKTKEGKLAHMRRQIAAGKLIVRRAEPADLDKLDAARARRDRGCRCQDVSDDV